MNLRPDHLFVQCFALTYFCSWLWLGISTAIIPVRDFAKRQLGIAVGIGLVVSAVIWCYLCVLILTAGANPFDVPLTIDLLLIAVLATTYFPLKPWSRRPVAAVARFVRVARVELGVAVVGLPIAGMIISFPLVAEFVGWFQILAEMYLVLVCLIVGLAVYTLAICKPPLRNYLLAAAVVVIALATTYLMLFTAEISAV